MRSSRKPDYAALGNFGSLKYEASTYAEAADLYRHAAELGPKIKIQASSKPGTCKYGIKARGKEIDSTVIIR